MLAAKLNSVAASTPPNYIEDVFSTYLYTGTGATQTITNGIDLAGKGGLVWTKGRSLGRTHGIIDTTRGITKFLNTTLSTGEATYTTTITNISSTGFIVGTDVDYNQSGTTYASWTFRKQPKFFDVVTYTGNGANRTIAHNLGSVPGCIIVKRTDTTGDWQVYHRGASGINPQNYMVLNNTAAFAVDTTVWNSTVPTSTDFSVGTNTAVNANGGTYVAYVFAHNAGGFGLTGSDNVISCGSYAGNGSATGPVVTLGYEPQWLMIKNASGTSNWQIVDNMRGIFVGSADATLQANLADAESTVNYVSSTATGFQVVTSTSQLNTNGNTYIYIAIRRGPMKVPTTGTSVFGLNAWTGTGANATATGSAGVSDAVLIKNRGAAVADLFSSRLTGTGYLVTSSSAAEVAAGTTILQANPWDVMDGVKVGTTSTITNASANTYINYLFDRAPGFFDVVCYTGTGVDGRVINHNLTVSPELFIYKARSAVTDWWVVSNANIANTLVLNATSAPVSTGTAIGSPTATTFTVGSVGFTNSSNQTGFTYVHYLFATCPGVSKVGSYTGNGSSQTINCGFTGGARFVLIKRTDSTGDWYVWDSARGIVAGNDPRFSLNTTAAEVTTDDSVDTNSTGFIVNQLAATNINVSSATYIFLAIA